MSEQKISEAYIEDPEHIRVYGAREHNLKNIDVTMPRNSLVVITGLSGSGKSSLAFDTIYNEGQRRYMDTMSAYARQFVGGLERPDVDKITGLSPVISIEQKTTNKNPRSTVGTITEIYDYLRLLFARTSVAYSYHTGEPMIRYTEEQIIQLVAEQYAGKKIMILSPVVKGRKGHYKELFEQIRKKGFLHVRVDGEIKETLPGLKVDRYKTHDIEIVVDKLTVTEDALKRLKESTQTAMKHGKDVMLVFDVETNQVRYFSKRLMCPTTGLSYNEPAPHTFSFNSPHGACHKCNGLGYIYVPDQKKLFPNPNLSIRKGGIAPLGTYKHSLIFHQLAALGAKYGFSLDTPIKDISEEALSIILNGIDEPLRLPPVYGDYGGYMVTFEGLVAYLQRLNESEDKEKKNEEIYFTQTICPQCKGQRLNIEALHFKIDNKNIAEVSAMDIETLAKWIDELEDKLTAKQMTIASEILKEIRSKVSFLLNVGLGYLSLDRAASTLSGGESQRIRLATQIGSQLVNVLYILDEPSIGLHPRDNHRLINSLKSLRDAGNSVIVVEHDKEMMEAADFIIDMGPHAGRHGGEVVACGKLDSIAKGKSYTAMYLSGKKTIPVPTTRRKGNGNTLILKGARGNNLKNIEVTFPLGTFICVTGVSGSGKSTLINETLYPILASRLHRALTTPLPYDQIQGIEHIDKVIDVDQQPIGRTPRSNPATYTGLFTDIRKLFEQTPDAKIRGYGAGRFSFNVKGGRCETCKGAGVETIEMNFLPNVYVPCKTCNGKRYNRETLEVKYKGESIGDVLDMTINQAVDFFSHIPSIHRKLHTLQRVGLGYLTLGQPSTTLSGGESQRLKLASELARKDTGRTLYILDEPTTGLHFEDIRILLEVLNQLVDKGNTVIVIEHNLDVIKVADYLIDLGPEGGEKGGHLVITGTPEEVVRSRKGYTAKFLAHEIKL
ncbi:MAG: excinuclease ABC subunit UvrA [Bacteroidales bacterium]|nr:excinuclease ABC subunit UvrA [Bacteroidales bacterium]